MADGRFEKFRYDGMRCEGTDVGKCEKCSRIFESVEEGLEKRVVIDACMEGKGPFIT